MANKKVTQREYFTEVVKVLNGEESKFSTEELIAFIDGRVALLDKKSSSKKPTKAQVANEDLKEVIIDILSSQENPITVSAIMVDPRIEVGTSNQKISSMLTLLRKEDKVVRTEEKGKAYYSIA